MNEFSERSKAALATCDERLQKIATIALEVIDFMVLEGHRNQDSQDKAFKTGRSELAWPESKHNKLPSLAMDCVPFPIDWHDYNRFHLLAGVMLGVAAALKIKVRWGGDWNRNGRSDDEHFKDFPHIEIEG